MCYEVNYVFLRTAVEWYPFGPCRITYKMMLNSMHCHHRVGLEISAKALLPLSQIPPECARSYCMPFHTSRSTLSCNIWKQTNKQLNKNNVVIEANRQTSYLLSEPMIVRSPMHIWVTRPHWVKWYTTLNSLRPSNQYVHQWTRPSLAQIMACPLLSTKPLSEPMLAYFQ